MFTFFLALYNGSQVSIVALWATCLHENVSLIAKTCFLENANNTCTGQLAKMWADPCNLISDIVVCCLEVIIPLDDIP